MIKRLYAGFDKIEVAFTGALAPSIRDALRSARDEAARLNEPQLADVTPNLEAKVRGHGGLGGYAFIFDTGQLGEVWFAKDLGNPSDWNIAASVHATALLALGFDACIEQIYARAELMGIGCQAESVRRIDFAMDFLAPGFEPRLDQMVSRGRAKVAPHWGPREGQRDELIPSAVLTGRKLESITVGNMPGAQVILYDKRKEAIARRKPFWFKAWGLPTDAYDAEVWRVELRAGKKELKDRYRLTTFANIRDGIGDVFHNMADRVRYLDDLQTDSNVSRQTLHPLWRAAQDALDANLRAYRSGLTPGQVRELARLEAMRNYERNILGNAIGYAVASSMDAETAETDLQDEVRRLILSDIAEVGDSRVVAAMDRARKKLRFLIPSP